MKNIVVVEDDQDIREVISWVLIDNRYSLTLLNDASSFKQYMQDHRPNVIVLDVMLPDGNGLDLCRNLKESNITRNIPVILMSANENIEAGETGASAFIPKPFHIKEFRDKVEGLL